ncbi:GntR family transcriptional regulator [Curtobacterium sp. 1P10AnD]|uniref:GntR family transcriptional regulator n=1 Tax=Curtobacterium sp. 1P10AnD TaxID=3132283 RepID=UPI0039A1CFB0
MTDTVPDPEFALDERDRDDLVRRPTPPWTDMGVGDVQPGHWIGFNRRSDAARQVSDLIRADIVAGRFAGPLPYEWELLDLYGTTRNVLRAALTLLKEQRLITRAPRSGTFGVRPVASVSLARTTDEVTIYGETAGGSIFDSPRLSIVHLCVQLVPAPETVRRNLEMDGDAAYFVESLISFDGEPSRVRTSWVPQERFPDLVSEPLTEYVPDVLVRRSGERPVARRLLLSTVNADQWTADLLDIDPGQAIFHIERLMCTADGTPVEYGFSRYRGDRAVIDSRVV